MENKSQSNLSKGKGPRLFMGKEYKVGKPTTQIKEITNIGGQCAGESDQKQEKGYDHFSVSVAELHTSSQDGCSENSDVNTIQGWSFGSSDAKRISIRHSGGLR